MYVIGAYVMLGILSTFLAQSYTHVNILLFTGAAIILPFRYVLTDIIAEIYRMKAAMHAMALLILTSLMFFFLAYFISGFHNPSISFFEAHHFTHAELLKAVASHDSYHILLSSSVYNTVYASMSVVVGLTINNILMIKILPKVKFLKKFTMRSFVSSAIGDLFQYWFGLTLILWGKMPYTMILHAILSDYIVQVSILLIIVPIGGILMRAIFKIENRS